MPKAKLDASFCLIAQCEPGRKRTDYYDTAIPGFVLECHTSGTKTYTLRYTDGYGRQKQHKLGRYGVLPFDQAKTKARRLRAKAELGDDPAAHKATKKATPTYAQLAADHLDNVRTYQRRPENTERVIRLHLLPRWGKKRLDEITTPDIAKWLANLRVAGQSPASVEKIRVIFGRSFELALQWGLPGVTTNPVRNVPRPKFNNARTRYLTSAEAKRLLDAAGRSDNPQLRNIIALLLLTGARKSELLNARWENVDKERRSWYIPTTKTGVPRYVPLSQAAMDVVNELPRWDDCSWLLPNPLTLKPYADIKRPWDTARAAAALDDVRLHDLRHSAASFMINAGIDLFAVGRILGHADHQSTMRYSHLANETLMQAVEAGAAKMSAGWAIG